MTFRSKMDAWIVVVIVAISIVALVTLIPALMQTTGVERWVVLPLMMLATVLPVWLLVSTRYVVDKDILTIKCGPFRWKVRLDEIESLQATRSPLSSPALSLDRVLIRYRNGRRVMVSPEDKQKFAAALGQQLE
ncbi:MAG: PH domain-containing protein [Pseudomonadota bacterium]